MPTTFSLLPALGVVCCLLTPALKATAQTKSELAILAVMQDKTNAYFAADTQKWQTFWLQDSSSSRAILSRFGYESQTGWPTVLAALTKDSRETGKIAATLTHENVRIRTVGEMAFVEADERITSPGIDSKQAARIHTYTVLVNGTTGWKIANQVRIDTDTYAPTTINREYELNAIGYDLLREKHISEAVDLLNLNVRLNPNSWNAYDSLGEAYALSGQTALAIANYEKSLVLNPQNDNAKTVLDRLTKRTR